MPEGPRLRDVGGHVGQREAQRLEVADRVAELDPLLEVALAILDRRAGDADGPGRRVDPGDVEAALDGGEPAGIRVRPLVAVEPGEPVALGHAHVLQPQLEGLEAVIADLVDHPAGHPGREAVALLEHQERLQAGGARFPRLRVAGPGQDLDEVGPLGEARPALGAGQSPPVAVAHRPGLHAGEVGAGIGFRQGDRADPLPPRRAPEQLRPAIRVEGLGAEALAAGQDAAHGQPGPGQFLRDQAVLEHAEAEAAVLRRDRDAEPAFLGHGVDERARHLGLVAVELVGERQHRVAGEGAGLGLQRRPSLGPPGRGEFRRPRRDQVLPILGSGHRSPLRCDAVRQLSSGPCGKHALTKWFRAPSSNNRRTGS